MKKIVTLLLVLGTVASASAQTSQEEARRIILGKQGGTTTDRRTTSDNPRDVILGGGDRRVYDESGSRYPSGTYGSRSARIDQVNREYNAKIQSIRNNRYLSSSEKERMIRQLEIDRERKIRRINDEYSRRDRRYDDDDRDDNKKYKKNNGNHYGWEKGKGNPHRSDGGYKAKGNSKGKGKH